MKRILIILSVLIFSCGQKEQSADNVIAVADTTLPTKIIDTTIFEYITVTDPKSRSVKKEKKEKVSCGFGFKKFNNRKRPISEAPGGVKGKPPKKPHPHDDPPPPPPVDSPSFNVVYLNFFGKTVSGTLWNTSGDFTVADAGFAQIEIDQALAQVKQHFTSYNVNITTDVNDFDAAAPEHKVEVIITESWEWYGQAGGVAYIGSFSWTNKSPAFVFSLLLNYNVHNIAEAVAHETGHTLGLRHQCDCENGVIVNQYSLGKTMGVSYYVPLGAWVIGTSSLSCTIQDDNAKITLVLGLKPTAYFLLPNKRNGKRNYQSSDTRYHL